MQINKKTSSVEIICTQKELPQIILDYTAKKYILKDLFAKESYANEITHYKVLFEKLEDNTNE